MSELDRLKIFPSFLFLKVAAPERSSSVVGGVTGCPIFGIRPSFGTFMLPLGFLFALISRPAGFLAGVRGLGLGLGTGGRGSGSSAASAWLGLGTGEGNVLGYILS